MLIEIFEVFNLINHLSISSTPFIRYEENMYTYTKSETLHDKIFNDLDNNKKDPDHSPKKRQKI